MSFLDRLSEGLGRTRERFTEQLNVILDRSPEVDEDFYEDLEDTLIMSDFGAEAALDIVDRLRESAQRLALKDAKSLLERLSQYICEMFTQATDDIFDRKPVCVMFVGINGSGKTTTVGKIANQGVKDGRKVLLGSADTFRAAAIEQLDIWAQRSEVEVVKRSRGADPASVSFEVIARAQEQESDLVLIDTAGRLHSSEDLMRELQKVVNVTRKRAEQIPGFNVCTVLVIDATTGQNGLTQARQFNEALDLDGVIITKLDGTAKGGIAVAISHELKLPILKIGIGETIEDLREFDAKSFADALVGRE